MTPDRRRFPYAFPKTRHFVSIPSWLRSALHVTQLTLWKTTRVALIVWGVLNGLGVGLVGQVNRVKQRISRRIPRVSGSIST